AIEGKSYPVNGFVKTPYGELKFIPQPSASTTLNPLYFTLIDPKKVTAGLVMRLKISSAGKLSSVINLKMIDESPKCAEDILNELILAYNWASINDKNTLAANTLAFIEERLNYVVKDLDSIEKKLQQYKATRGAIDIGSQGTLFLQNVSAVDQRLGDVNTQLAVLNQVENYVKAKDKSGGIVPSTVGVTDPMLSQLLTKLYDNELQYENLKKTTGENNPVIVSITDQIEKIKPSILENIQSQKVSLEANRNNLSSTINHFSSMLQSIPQKERDLVEISREQNVKSSIYNFLLQKREETGLSLSSSISDSRVVDKAQASFGPVSPRKKLTYLIFILAAVVLAVGLVTTNEMLKRTIMFRQEIESYTSIPVIGEIVFDKSRTPLVIGNGKRTFIAEQFRSLRTSLPYIGLNSNKKKLLVTSTVSGEGKSFIVANLGISLAMAGKKVVVLEFDLSDPTLSEKLSFSGSKGLTDYLTGNAEPEEIVRRTAVHENLFIMPAGPLPDNPSEMIMSEKVPELMQYLTEIFDYIILDTAPVGLLSDAYILTAYCDATLYVVRHRRTRKVSIERLDENNKINELKNMGIVFNGVRARGFNKNGYGYGYGYGYIFNEKKKRKKKERKHDTVE
ncbi:MAG TPA: polysaccharide biosynthesis tyrosine autokinase, partial [Chitinophagaceae bacterium]|nr:polysaccharide biosynthesis tyrosine autokinase [Chitinophagaceae bacterium]